MHAHKNKHAGSFVQTSIRTPHQCYDACMNRYPSYEGIETVVEKYDDGISGIAEFVGRCTCCIMLARANTHHGLRHANKSNPAGITKMGALSDDYDEDPCGNNRNGHTPVDHSLIQPIYADELL